MVGVGVEVGVAGVGAGGVGRGGKSRGGRLGVGVGMVGAGVEGAVTGADGVAVPPSLAIVSSASFMRRSVAFWKISSSLTMVVYTLGRSGSAVLLTISMRLILIGSRSGESINKFTSDCLFNVSGITYTVYESLDMCQLSFLVPIRSDLFGVISGLIPRVL